MWIRPYTKSLYTLFCMVSVLNETVFQYGDDYKVNLFGTLEKAGRYGCTKLQPTIINYV